MLDGQTPSLFDQLDVLQQQAHAAYPVSALPGTHEPPVTPDPTPEERRDQGIKTAIEHANAEEPKWSERAGVYLRGWLRRNGDPFLVEEMIEDAEREGFPAPPSKKAWGGVIQKLAHERAVVKIGYASAKSSNCSPKCLWQRNPDWKYS